MPKENHKITKIKNPIVNLGQVNVGWLSQNAK